MTYETKSNAVLAEGQQDATMSGQEPQTCTGCGRRCPLDQLECGLGRRLLAESQGAGASGDAPEGGRRRGAEGRAEGERGRRGHGGRGEGPEGQRGRHGHGPERGEHDGGERRGGGRPGHGRHGHGPDGRHGHGPEGRGGRGPHGRGAHGPEGPHGRGPADAHADDERLAHVFYHCARMLVRRQSSEGGRASALVVLLRHEGMTQAALADKLDIRPASASELLAKMEADGLVGRTADPQDGRALTVELTDAGREAAMEVLERRRRADEDLFDALDDGEKAQLQATLSKLAGAWRR